MRKIIFCRIILYKLSTIIIIIIPILISIFDSSNIPCFKCDECDEIFYTGDVAQKIEEITERVKMLVQEITVVDYEKAA